jgi:hypothetical protein
MAMTAPEAMSSRQASSSSFSAKGSPTWTVGRFSSASASKAAVDAVAPGLRSEIDDRIADSGRRRGEDRVPLGDADRHRVDEDVAVIAPMEARRAADRRHAERIAVAADPRDDPGDQTPRLRMVGRAEAQKVERRDWPCAHGEDVAQNAANPGRRALIGLDEGGMVVALHLEYADVAVANVDHARVLARPVNNVRAFGRQLAQMKARRLVRAMLVPHRRDDAELGEGRGPADQRDEPRIFVRLEAMRDGERFVHLGFGFAQRPAVFQS